MAMSVVYTTFGGMLVHENRGGTERQYISDPLGSLVGELDSTQAVTYTAEYWPYGEIQAETGTNTSNWSYVGLLGYLKDLASLLYVRARHYLTQKARWLTVDPLWPFEMAYGYAGNGPVAVPDPLGLALLLPCPPLAILYGISACIGERGWLCSCFVTITFSIIDVKYRCCHKILPVIPSGISLANCGGMGIGGAIGGGIRRTV